MGMWGCEGGGDWWGVSGGAVCMLVVVKGVELEGRS